MKWRGNRKRRMREGLRWIKRRSWRSRSKKQRFIRNTWNKKARRSKMATAFKSNELKLCFWGVRLPSAIGRPDQHVGLPSCKTAQRVHLLGISWYSIRLSIFKTGKSRVRFPTAHVHEGPLALNGLICKSAGSLLRRSSSCYQGLDKRLLCTMQSTPTVHRLQTCSPQFAALSMFSVCASATAMQVPFKRCEVHKNIEILTYYNILWRSPTI